MTVTTINDELERGRLIATRTFRRAALEKMLLEKRVACMVALHGHPLWEERRNRSGDEVGRVNLFYVGNVRVAHQNTADDDYPSEVVMSTLYLALEVQPKYPPEEMLP